MARPSNTEERRRQITAGLRSVLAERGFEQASVARVAEAAGLSPGLVHYHFGSKAEILLALADELTAAAWHRVDARLALAGEDPRDRLGALLDGLLALGPDADPDAVRCWALLGADAARREDVRGVYQGFVAELARRLRAALGEVLVAEGRSQAELGALAAALVAAAEGFVRVSVAAPGVVPPGTAAATARRMAFGLVDAQPEEA